MVFFLMKVIAIMFIIITLTSIFSSFYKQGTLLEKKPVFFTLTGLIFIELIVSFTAQPSNFIIERIIAGTLMVALVVNIFIYNKSFNLTRLILAIISFAALLAFLFL